MNRDHIVDGDAIADEIAQKIKDLAVSSPKKRACFISFGVSTAGRSFVEKKLKIASEIGIVAENREENPKNTAEALSVLKQISSQGYDGIIVQLPVARFLDTAILLNAVPRSADIDVLGDIAINAFINKESKRMPPVARVVEKIFKNYSVNPNGKKIVVLGSGRLVGKPVSIYLKINNIPHVVLDRKTPETERIEQIKSADIVISGIGVPHYIKPNMIKEGVILIDAGTSGEEGRIQGDADPACQEKTTFYTPVPGGVGPITVASLFYNLYLT